MDEIHCTERLLDGELFCLNMGDETWEREPIKYRDLETKHGDLPIQNRNLHDLNR